MCTQVVEHKQIVLIVSVGLDIIGKYLTKYPLLRQYYILTESLKTSLLLYFVNKLISILFEFH